METLMPSDGNGDVPLNRQSSYLIEKTVRIHQQAPDFYSDIKVITRSHWIPSEQRPCCSRKKCRKKFTFMERPHHCRRCGEVFCWECTQFRRRLNKLANPDPDGGEYKVCQECYNQGPQGVGARRSLLEEYQQARRVCKDVARAREMGERRAGWRNRLDLEKECQRLIAGFKAELNRWEITKALTELKKMVTLPEWQKGMNYLQEDLNTTCQTCGVVFNRLLNKKHHCRVCALAVCTKCSTQDLLLYIPDSKMPPAPGGGLRIPAIMASTLSNLGDLLWRPSLTVEPELAIIEIVGCPDKEPNISIYLRVCEPCKTALTDIQVKKHRNSVRLVEDDFLTKLQKLFEEFWDLRKKIDHRLDKYFTTIDSLENNSAGSQQKGVQSQSNMKVLAKAQADLSDFFTAYIMKVQQLKQLKQLSQTPAQGKLYQAFVKSKCEYYMENMYTFRNGRKKLAAISPPEMLELIQKIVDKDAIVSSHLYIKQLLFEALHLTQKHKVLNDLPAALLKLEQTMEKEVELCLKRQQEDWEEHLSLMEQILQSQIKHRKLIRPSRRQSLRSGSSHIYEIIKLRSGEVAEKILYQLEMKSAYNSFPKSVAALREFRDVLDVM